MDFYKVLGYIFVHWKVSLLVLILICVLPPIIISINTKKKIRALSNDSLEMTPDEFFKMRSASLGGRGRKHISTAQDYVGVYVLFNETKNMYYVGQAKKYCRESIHILQDTAMVTFMPIINTETRLR